MLDMPRCNSPSERMPIMRTLMACLALLIPALAGAQDTVRVDDGRLRITYGAFCQQLSVGEVAAPDTLANKVDLLPSTPDIRWPGTRIPAAPGISFGVRSETPDGATYDPVVIEVSHPPLGGTGPDRQSYLTRLGGDGPSINAYSFDVPEELVTGQWTLRATYFGRLLYQVTFDVVPAETMPQIANACDQYLGS